MMPKAAVAAARCWASLAPLGQEPPEVVLEPEPELPGRHWL
jgi:hypothetical protein